MAKGIAIRSLALALSNARDASRKPMSSWQWQALLVWGEKLASILEGRVVYNPHQMPFYQEYFQQTYAESRWQEVGILRKWYVKAYDFIAVGAPLYSIGSRVVYYSDWGCQSGQIITKLCVPEGTSVNGETVLRSTNALGYRNWLRSKKGIEVDLPDDFLRLFSDEPLCPRLLDLLRESGLSDQGRRILLKIEKETYEMLERSMHVLAQRLVETAGQCLVENREFVAGQREVLEKDSRSFVSNIRSYVRLFGD